MSHAEITFFEQHFRLLPERALWWSAQNALLIADVHLGKDEVFRQRGIAIPSGLTLENLNRIDQLIRRYSPAKLYILGDWIHGKPSDELINQITKWRNSQNTIDITIVEGNHDRHLSKIPVEWKMEAVDHQKVEGIRLLHESVEQPPGPEICGHIHPAFRIHQPGIDAIRAPVFWIQKQRLVLPSFGTFTGGYLVNPAKDDRVYAIGPESVMDVSMFI